MPSLSRILFVIFYIFTVVWASNDPPPTELTVHIIAHSHCDPGWLESFEGYYMSQVATILSSVLSALESDPKRKFQWAEISFFMRWYEVQSDNTKAKFHQFVKEGRIEFVGGGWVQNDEANPDPAAIISQITEGHEYLRSLFGVRPRIAWQIDPFGHSGAMAAIAAATGYEAIVINRIEYTIKDNLKARSAMEFMWEPYYHNAENDNAAASARYRSSPHYAATYGNASIFTHVLHTHYSAPRGYDFENPEGFPVGDHNVGSRASALVQDLKNRARAYRTTHLLVPFGDDFKFQNAHHQFQNMDRLIKYINARSGRKDADHLPEGGATNVEHEFAGIRMRYSTLSDYFDAVFNEVRGGSVTYDKLGTDSNDEFSAVVPIPVFSPRTSDDAGVDFFPYADNQHSFWTGYYVSRPQLKGAIRRTTALLRSTESLFSIVRPWSTVWQQTAGDIILRYVRDTVQDPEKTTTDASLPSLDRYALSSAPYNVYSWLRAFQRIEQVRLDAALCLHHDSITGTSRESVVNDYARRMGDGYTDIRGLIADLASLQLGGLHRTLVLNNHNLERMGTPGDDALTAAPAPLTYVPHVLPVNDYVEVKLLLNNDKTYTIETDVPAHPIVVYNPLGWRRKVPITVMVDLGTEAFTKFMNTDGTDDNHGCQATQWPFGIVTNDESVVIPSQWTATIENGDIARELWGKAKETGDGTREPRSSVGENAQGRPLGHIFPHAHPEIPEWASKSVRYELVFLADLPPLSLSTFFVTAAWHASQDKTQTPTKGSICGSGIDDEVLKSVSAMGTSSAIVMPGLKIEEYKPVVKTTGQKGYNSAAITTVGEEIMQERLVVAPAAFTSTHHASTDASSSPIILENGCLRIEMNPKTGTLTGITRKHADNAVDDTDETDSAVHLKVHQRFAAYHTRQSGAYIFRPVDAPVDMGAAAGNEDEPGEMTVAVSVAPHGDAVDTESSPSDAQKHAGGAIVQTVRVVGPNWKQTVRLTDTLGWYNGAKVTSAMCADPLNLDAGLEIIPSLGAAGNTEVVMMMDTNIDIIDHTNENRLSTNPRDNYGGSNPSSSADPSAATCDRVPIGWWTSDGLGLLRRTPARTDLSAADATKFFYPLNTLTRLAGTVVSDATDSSNTNPMAWLSVYTQQPFGVMAQTKDKEGSHIEIMLHRHLLQDDGRGLASPVSDGTRLSPKLLLTVGARVNTNGQKCDPTSTSSSSTSASSSSSSSTSALHPDWVWTWSTTSILHTQSVVTLHADLDTDSLYDGQTTVRPLSTNKEGRIVPPLDAALGLGIHEEKVSLAEPAIPRSVWLNRFGTSYKGLGNVNKQLQFPPWIHLHTVQSRDAVSDEIALRLQNIGGPETTLSVPQLLDTRTKQKLERKTKRLPSYSGLSLTTLVPRSLSMNRDTRIRSVYTIPRFFSKGAARILQDYPLATVSVLDSLLNQGDAVRVAVANALGQVGSRHASSLLGGGEHLDVARQNTEEEGVFLSDAALAKLAQDQKEQEAKVNEDSAAGRSLASVDEETPATKSMLRPKVPPANEDEERVRDPLNPARLGLKPPTLVNGKLPHFEPPPSLPKGGQGMRRNVNDGPGNIGLPDSAALNNFAPPPGPLIGMAEDPKLRNQFTMPGDKNNLNHRNKNGPGGIGRRLLQKDTSITLVTNGKRSTAPVSTVTLPPLSFTTFMITLEAPMVTNAIISITDTVQESTITVPKGSKKATDEVPRNGNRNDEPAENSKGTVKSGSLDDWHNGLLDLINYVSLPEKDKERMRNIILDGKDLTAVDQRRLITASRVATRKHSQPVPKNLDELIRKWVKNKDKLDEDDNGSNNASSEESKESENTVDTVTKTKDDLATSRTLETESTAESTKATNDITKTNLPSLKDLPEDPWAKNFLAAENRDYFDEMRNPRVRNNHLVHDHDAGSVSVDFVKDNSDDIFDGILSLFVSFIIWIVSIGITGICILYCCRRVSSSASAVNRSNNSNGVSGIISGNLGGIRSTNSGKGGNSILPTTTNGSNGPRAAANGSWFEWSPNPKRHPAKMV